MAAEIETKTKTIIELDGIALEEAGVTAVKRAAEAALSAENAETRYASIVLTNDETIHACNRDYRGVDRPTDVLSFASNEGDALIVPPDGFIGDIMISVPTAQRQADELGHSLERELAFLTVHGILHLLGYDHIEKDDEEKMLERQRIIIKTLELD